MSYMNYPRITFSGKFQADTSTVNNDPRHFSNEDFEPRFQEYQTKEELNVESIRADHNQRIQNCQSCIHQLLFTKQAIPAGNPLQLLEK